MMHLDLSSALNLISTVAIVGALVFAGLQVRAAAGARRDQAAVTVIHTTQSERWLEALALISTLPEGAEPEQIVARGEAMERAVFEFGIHLETIGYLVYCRIITLEAVDDLIGGVILVYWSRAEKWMQRYRGTTNNQKMGEWAQWLYDRMTERRARVGSGPAQNRYRDWKE